MQRARIALLLLYFTTACSKQIDFPLEFEGERLVLFSFVTNNSGINAHITKTAPPTGETIYKSLFVDDATVVVLEDKLAFDTLVPLGDGNYSGRKVPDAEKKYSISASKNGFPIAVSSEQVLPKKINIQVNDVRANKINPINQGFSTLDFKMNIEDIPNEKNYYVLDAVIIINGVPERAFNLWLPNQSDFIADPCKTDAFFFPDDCFDGKVFETYIALETTSLLGEKAQEVEVSVRSITKEYYEYLKRNQSQPEGFEIPFSQPVFNYTNIFNGYGLFGAYTEQTIRLKL